MKKIEIFDDIVSIMQNDSATIKDIKGADPLKYRDRISEDMNNKEFTFLVRSYLASFGLTGHLEFDLKDRTQWRLFDFRRYNDELIITNASKESDFLIGDRITQLNGISVKDFGELHKEFLKGESEERQRITWLPLLEMVDTVTFNREGKVLETRKLFGNKWDRGEKYICKEIQSNIAYIYLADFNDEEKIQQLYADNAEMLNNATGLIIDVRGNAGGVDSAFFPLFTYCLPNGLTYNKAVKPDYSPMDKGMEIIYTDRNCKKRTELLEDYLSKDIPEESKKMISEMIDDLKTNAGKGFIKNQSSDDDDDDLPFVGNSKVEKVIILTDEDCGSSGDSFVYHFSLLPKVSIVGRPTMGILDYSNVIFNYYDEYIFIYPTSRLVALDTDPGMMRHGIPVDVYIPWTPEHLYKDITLEEALKMF